MWKFVSLKFELSHTFSLNSISSTVASTCTAIVAQALCWLWLGRPTKLAPRPKALGFAVVASNMPPPSGPVPDRPNPCDCAHFFPLAAPKPSDVTRISSQTPQASYARMPEAGSSEESSQSFLWGKSKMKKIDSNPLFNPRTGIVTRVGCAATGLVLCPCNTLRLLSELMKTLPHPNTQW